MPTLREAVSDWKRNPTHAFQSLAVAAEAERQRMSRLCINYNGYVYKSLADHDPHSTTAIDEGNKLYSLDPAWELCPNTPDALHVCRTYPWAGYALIFADGSAHWTKIAPSRDPSLEPGTCATSSTCLRQEGEQYGVLLAADAGWFFFAILSGYIWFPKGWSVRSGSVPDGVTRGCIEGSSVCGDVLIRRKF